VTTRSRLSHSSLAGFARLLAFVVVSIGTGSCTPKPENYQIPSNAVVLDQTSGFPCELRLEHLGIDLEADIMGMVPEVGSSIVRTSLGRFYSTIARGQELATWSEDGRFAGVIARSGQGPGEISGQAELFIDATDSLHVRDIGRAWSIFDPDGRFARRERADHIGNRFSNTHFLDNGAVLSTTAASAAGEKAYFFITSRAGSPLNAFGEPDLEDLPLIETGGLHRLTAYSGGNNFWAAPRHGSKRGYQLEQWSLDGALLGTIQRVVPWFPLIPIEQSRRPTDRNRRPDPGVSRLHVDSTGILLVEISVPNDTWQALDGDQLFARDITEMYDHYYDVIDSRQAVVLASGRVDRADDLPYRLFRSSRDGYRLTAGDHGLRRAEMITWKAVPAEPRHAQLCR
jgi:hypothetical protein